LSVPSGIGEGPCRRSQRNGKSEGMYDQKVRPQSSVAIRWKSTNNVFWAHVQSEGVVMPNPMPKTIVSIMGKLAENIIVPET
jgi:hypothetical protein